MIPRIDDFEYVASDGSNWEIVLEPPGIGPWYVIEATPAGGGLPIVGRRVDQREQYDNPIALGMAIGQLISSIEERCRERYP